MKRNIDIEKEQQKKGNNEYEYEIKPLNLNLLSSEDLHGPTDFGVKNTGNIQSHI